MIITEREQLEAAISAKQVEIKDKEYEINTFELDQSDYEDKYKNLLDECYEGIFGLLPSRILSDCDPVQYYCGLNNYVDSLDVSDDADYKVLETELEDLETELEELEEELEEMED